jgi:hypothetical protein
MAGWLNSRGVSPPAMPNASRESIRAKTILMRLIQFTLEQTQRIRAKSQVGFVKAERPRF